MFADLVFIHSLQSRIPKIWGSVTPMALLQEGFGCIPLYPYQITVWRHPWPPDTIVALVSDTNTSGTLTNSDLEITTLILHEDSLLEVCPDTNMAAPCSGSNNTPTVSLEHVGGIYYQTGVCGSCLHPLTPIKTFFLLLSILPPRPGEPHGG